MLQSREKEVSGAEIIEVAAELATTVHGGKLEWQLFLDDKSISRYFIRLR